MSSRGASTFLLVPIFVVGACSLDVAGSGEAAPEPEQPDDPKPGFPDGPGLDASQPAPMHDADQPLPDQSTQDAGQHDREDANLQRCDRGLELIVRDFTDQHVDFEKNGTALTGIVATMLGPDRKPVLALSAADRWMNDATVPRAFAQWYHDAPGVNQRLSEWISFNDDGKGLFIFDSPMFFPIDKEGFGNGPVPVSNPFLDSLGFSFDHNYLFTTEAHTRFTYMGGEQFGLSGDDDMWVFINDRLAIDLGGVHLSMTGTVNLDAQAQKLGLVLGESYPLDIFHAERHTVNSHYSIHTTIDFSCIRNVAVPP
jgi:fibro-slime domain-containing protein